MSAPYIPPNISQLTPYLFVRDADASLTFYEKAFGFKATSECMKDDQGKIQHAHMSFENVHIMFGPEGAWDMPNKSPKSAKVTAASSLYIYCKDVDAYYQRAIHAGAVSLMEPTDMFWGDRMCKITDPDGHEWNFATFSGKESL